MTHKKFTCVRMANQSTRQGAENRMSPNKTSENIYSVFFWPPSVLSSEKTGIPISTPVSSIAPNSLLPSDFLGVPGRV